MEGNIQDPKYEFNAPKFYNFEDMVAAEEAVANPDAWFDTSAVKALRSPLSPGKEVGVDQENACAKQPKQQHAKDMQQQARPAENPLTEAKPNVPKLNLSKLADDQASAAVKRKQRDVSLSSTASGATNRTALTDRPSSGRSTHPHSPQLATARRHRAPSCAKSTDDLQWEKVQSEAAEARRLMKQNEGSYQRALRPASHATLGGKHYSTKPLTEPEDPMLHTSKRQRANEHVEVREWKSMAQASAEAMLRSSNPSSQQQQHASAATKPGPTPVAEFDLQTAKRHRQQEHVEVREWKSMAQISAEAMLRSTTNPSTQHAPAGNSAVPKHAETKAPSLSTSSRVRPSRYKTREELEAEEMATMPTFHARPISAHVMQSHGEIGLPKTSRRPPTTSHPFQLHTDQRAAAHNQQQPAAAMVPQPEQHQFKALPLPRHILEAQHAQQPRVAHLRAPTVPQSPALATKQRALQHSPPPRADPQPLAFKALPLPDYGHHQHAAAARPAKKRASLRPQGLQPFNLRTEQRGATYQAQLAEQQARDKMEARLARDFKAHPVPMSTEEPYVPSAQAWAPPPLTVPQPFTLRSQQLHEAEERRRAEEAAREEALRRQQAEFKARPLPVVDEPFAPQASARALTVPESPHLKSDARAAMRGAFDATLAEKARVEEQRRAAEAEERDRREAEELREYRRTLQFKARPLPDH